MMDTRTGMRYIGHVVPYCAFISPDCLGWVYRAYRYGMNYRGVGFNKASSNPPLPILRS